MKYGPRRPVDGTSSVTPGPALGSYTILATACIAPESSATVTRRDPAERLTDYVSSLSWWADHPDPLLGDLVVLENSGFDAERLQALIAERRATTRRRVEVLAYRASARPPGVHYGYSEFRMLDELMDQSKLLGERFVKTTGRYVYPRSAELIRSMPGARFAIDSKRRPRIPFVFQNPARSCKAGLFVAEREFFDREVRHLYRHMRPENRKTHIEDLIYDHLIGRHGAQGVIMRFPIECPPRGVGGNGQDLSARRKLFESKVRAIQRRIAPSFWI